VAAVSVGRTYLFPPLSSGGALVVRPWLRFHIPLIEPDRRLSRIQFSAKTSRLHPRHVAPERGQAYEPEVPVRDAMGGGEEIVSIVADMNRWSRASMQRPNDLSKSPTLLKQDNTLIAVIEMSLSSWLVAGIVPGVERRPLKKLEQSMRARC
jgi:hypothetical protein